MAAIARLKRPGRASDALVMAHVLSIFASLLFLFLFGVSDVRAQSCEIAPNESGPVSILILDSPQRVAAFVESVQGANVAVRDRGTVIFDDGRVVTADPDAATRQLNGLGWGNRPIQIVASMPLRPKRAPGGG